MTKKQPKALNRIVIGDVGSGKTIVAFVIALAYLQGLKSSGQAVLLAPTEVLAFQHYQKLLELREQIVSEFEFDAVFLTSKNVYYNGEKLTKKKLEKILNSPLLSKGWTAKQDGVVSSNVELLANFSKTKKPLCSSDISPYQGRKPLFWVGTHALLYSDWVRADLVMVDEQHRFGVKQRKELVQGKFLGESNSDKVHPHFLSFTATPIPRTLALTLYKSLKPYFLETLEGRKDIATGVKTFENFERGAVNKITDELGKNRKVYVVCPRVEEATDDDQDELWSVKKAEKLFERYFPGRVLTVHGKMAEKKDILAEFKDSDDKNILVATTVVEVGVDVSEATLVVILNAERFGLAALHQIRGRVGRNNYDDNECVLVTYAKYQRAKRLQYLCQTNDGFKLAEKDLELRGSGDFLGKLQSGYGDEIDQIIGLNPDLYYQIEEMVEKIDFKNLDKLPRLQNFLKKQAEQVWEE